MNRQNGLWTDGVIVVLLVSTMKPITVEQVCCLIAEQALCLKSGRLVISPNDSKTSFI